MKLSRRVADLETSVTLALSARAKALARAGRDVVDMAVGEPDFPAPRVVQEAAVEKVRSGDVRYTPAGGTPSLRAAIARTAGAARGFAVTPAEVTVCHSGKHALSGALLSILDDGDEVLIPLPAWVSYFEQVKIAGATPVLVPPFASGAPDLAALAAAVTPRTRVVMINSPCNPTGYVWTPAEIRSIAELAVARDLWILSDEIYATLVYEGPPAMSPASISPEVRARTILVDGASKRYAMTGYRIGFVIAPVELAAAVERLHSQMTGSPNAISQHAYEAALRADPPELEEMRRRFAARRTVLVAGLRALELPTPDTRGAFYAFPDVSRYLDGRGSAGFCEDLLEKEGLALVPGSAFGMDAHVRLSFATDEDTIREALRRLGRFLATVPR
ncbi:MAG: pyridoxal phosphate-dependent aminotransferase [Planctomycetota bacterium]